MVLVVGGGESGTVSFVWWILLFNTCGFVDLLVPSFLWVGRWKSPNVVISISNSLCKDAEDDVINSTQTPVSPTRLAFPAPGTCSLALTVKVEFVECNQVLKSWCPNASQCGWEWGGSWASQDSIPALLYLNASFHIHSTSLKLVSFCLAPDLFFQNLNSSCYKLHILTIIGKNVSSFCILCPVTHTHSIFTHCFMNSTSIDEHLLCTKHQASNFTPSFHVCVCMSLSACMKYFFWF